MTSCPAISVCIPTYNYGRFLPVCVESILGQSFSDWELIVCDDCSTDDTDAIMEHYSKRDKRITYIRNPVRLGMAGNLKRVADEASGKFMKMLCSDDWLEPRCLQLMYDLMERYPNASLGTSAEISATETGEAVRIQFVFGHDEVEIGGEKMLNRMARGHGFGGNSSFVIRRDAYRKIGGYDAKILYASDYDLAARLCKVGSYVHTDEALFYGRRHGSSSSSVNPKLLLDVVDWFEIPRSVFADRRVGSLDWLRLHHLTALLTARYSLNLVLHWGRGEREYAKQLATLLRKYGSPLGGAYLLPHILARLAGRLSGDGLPPGRSLQGSSQVSL